MQVLLSQPTITKNLTQDASLSILTAPAMPPPQVNPQALQTASTVAQSLGVDPFTAAQVRQLAQPKCCRGTATWMMQGSEVCIVGKLFLSVVLQPAKSAKVHWSCTCQGSLMWSPC